MEEKKLFSRTCPKCRGLYRECTFAKVGIGVGVHANMVCEQGHKWSEFYSLTYRGYWSNGKMYDSLGEELKND